MKIRSFGRQLKGNAPLSIVEKVEVKPKENSVNAATGSVTSGECSDTKDITDPPIRCFASSAPFLSFSREESQVQKKASASRKRSRAKYCEKQLLLDFGQKGHEDIIHCRLCGMLYAPKTLDEEIHNKFCAKAAPDTNFNITLTKDMPILKEFDNGRGFIIMVDGSSTSQPFWKKVVAIKEHIDRTTPLPENVNAGLTFLETVHKSQGSEELPRLMASPAQPALKVPRSLSTPAPTSASPSSSPQQLFISPAKPFIWKFGKARAYLYVWNRQTVVGFLLAEQISGGYYLIDVTSTQTSVIPSESSPIAVSPRPLGTLGAATTTNSNMGSMRSESSRAVEGKPPKSPFDFDSDSGSEPSQHSDNKENIDPDTCVPTRDSLRSQSTRPVCRNLSSGSTYTPAKATLGKKQRAVMGVVQLWVSPDVTEGGKSKVKLPSNTVRQQLLRAAQESLIYGYDVEEREVAYQFPLSADTQAFAEQFHPSPSEILCYFPNESV